VSLLDLIDRYNVAILAALWFLLWLVEGDL